MRSVFPPLSRFVSTTAARGAKVVPGTSYFRKALSTRSFRKHLTWYSVNTAKLVASAEKTIAPPLAHSTIFFFTARWAARSVFRRGPVTREDDRGQGSMQGEVYTIGGPPVQTFHQFFFFPRSVDDSMSLRLCLVCVLVGYTVYRRPARRCLPGSSSDSTTWEKW